MKVRLFSALLALLLGMLPLSLAAQTTGWIQVEAHADLPTTRQRARILAARLDEVRAFRLDTGWYAIALGPLPEPRARDLLSDLRRRGLVPGDAYVTDGQEYRNQVLPREGEQMAQLQTPDLAESVATAPAEPPEETLAEAQRSEFALNGEERRALQIALAWFGYYTAGIDGAFGPGTRAAMAEWQRENGHDATSVLTTRQRAQLLKQYREARARIGLAQHVDEAAGIAVDLPLGLIRFDRHVAPFAHFEPATDAGVRGFLISQPGDAAALAGLFDVIQTLEVIPQGGERRRDRNSFTIAAEGPTTAAHVWAQQRSGRIKGFALIWPRSLDRTMARVVPAVRDSFRDTGPNTLDNRLDGGGSLLDGVDLVAGLERRRPRFSRSGVFIDSRGTVLTTAERLQGCERITLDHDIGARIVLVDEALGIAVLQPTSAVSPLARAEFSTATPRPGSDVAVGGYPFGGSLGAASVSWGQLSGATGLSGEPDLRRLSLRAEPGDAGGPVLDRAGALTGVLLGSDSTERSLPEDVHFAVSAQALLPLLETAGIRIDRQTASASLPPETMADRARSITTLVSCWDE